MRVGDALRLSERFFLAVGRSRVWLTVAIVAILIPYAWASLFPLEISVPREIRNGAIWTVDGGLAFPEPGLAATPAPPTWLGWAKRTSRLQLDLRVRAFEREAGTIFTISEHINARNLIVEQRASGIIVRLKTTCHGSVVGAWGCDVAIHERDVLEPGEWVDLQVQIVPGRLRLLVADDRWAERDLPPMPLQAWDEGYRLALGSEVAGHRSWLGEIQEASIRTPGFVGDYVDPGKLELPPEFMLRNRELKLGLFEAVSTKDVARNAIMYTPMGIAFALLGLWPGRFGVLRAALAIGLISLSMETAQQYISTRNPSATDLLLNVIGGTLGFLVFRLFRWPPGIGAGPEKEMTAGNPG